MLVVACYHPYPAAFALPLTTGETATYTPGAPPTASFALPLFVVAYNTKKVKAEDLPKTYKDLLDPKWKGKFGIEAKNQDWFATVVGLTGGGDKGLKFFSDLVAVNGLSPRKGHTLLNNLVVSGEVPLALTVYNYMPEQAKKKGAPVEWFALEPAVKRSPDKLDAVLLAWKAGDRSVRAMAAAERVRKQANGQGGVVRQYEKVTGRRR